MPDRPAAPSRIATPRPVPFVTLPAWATLWHAERECGSSNGSSSGMIEHMFELAESSSHLTSSGPSRLEGRHGGGDRQIRVVGSADRAAWFGKTRARNAVAEHSDSTTAIREPGQHAAGAVTFVAMSGGTPTVPQCQTSRSQGSRVEQ